MSTRYPIAVTPETYRRLAKDRNCQDGADPEPLFIEIQLHCAHCGAPAQQVHELPDARLVCAECAAAPAALAAAD